MCLRYGRTRRWTFYNVEATLALKSCEVNAVQRPLTDSIRYSQPTSARPYSVGALKSTAPIFFDYTSIMAVFSTAINLFAWPGLVSGRYLGLNDTDEGMWLGVYQTDVHLWAFLKSQCYFVFGLEFFSNFKPYLRVGMYIIVGKYVICRT